MDPSNFCSIFKISYLPLILYDSINVASRTTLMSLIALYPYMRQTNSSKTVKSISSKFSDVKLEMLINASIYFDDFRNICSGFFRFL